MKQILIIKHGALGDVVRTSYFLSPLKQKYPDSQITWITKTASRDLLKLNPHISTLRFNDRVEDTEEAWNDLASHHFDWVISLDDEAEALYFLKHLSYKKLSGAYQTPTGVAYTDDCAEWFDMGLISKLGKARADELKKLNRRSHGEIFSTMLGLTTPVPEFFGDSSLAQQFAARSTSKRIGLNLSAGKRWPSKWLEVSQAKELIPSLLTHFSTAEIVVLGGADDLEYNQNIYAPFASEGRVSLIEPMPLLSFSALIQSLDLLISSDSLALHLAISQRVPTLSFYSPTSAVEIDVFNSGAKLISTSADYCNYSPNADNSSITAKRLLEVLSTNSMFQAIKT